MAIELVNKGEQTFVSKLELINPLMHNVPKGSDILQES